jgi:hypothetical protein
MSTLRAARAQQQAHAATSTTTPFDPKDSALRNPLFDHGDGEEGDDEADDEFQQRRCCCFRGSKRACLVFSLAVTGVVVFLVLFAYFILLRLFVEAVLNSAAINVTLMRIGAPVSATQAPVVASLSAELDVPQFNLSVHFTDTKLGYYPPGVVPGGAGAGSVTLGTMGDISECQITLDHNTSRALLQASWTWS